MAQELFEAMARSVIEGEVPAAQQLAGEVIERGVDPLAAINRGFVTGLNEVGERYGCGDMFLPDLVLAAEAMKTAVAILEPEIIKRGETRRVLGRVVTGTVEGDIHDIGKTLVSTMLSAGGFRVHDLGVDVSVAALIDKIQAVQADIVGVSALLTTTMLKQKELIEALEEAGLRDRVKVMVGGAPVTRSWAEEIGADGYSEDALGAVAEAKRLMGAI